MSLKLSTKRRGVGDTKPQADRKGKSALGEGPKKKLLNLETYKWHALPDYPQAIRRFGTTDNTTTQTVYSTTNSPLIFATYYLAVCSASSNIVDQRASLPALVERLANILSKSHITYYDNAIYAKFDNV